MGSYLKNTGKLLIAIENKLGMKYFAGAPEDHTDIPFFGINGYPGNHSVRTFSKTELQELVKKMRISFSKNFITRIRIINFQRRSLRMRH